MRTQTTSFDADAFSHKQNSMLYISYHRSSATTLVLLTKINTKKNVKSEKGKMMIKRKRKNREGGRERETVNEWIKLKKKNVAKEPCFSTWLDKIMCFAIMHQEREAQRTPLYPDRVELLCLLFNFHSWLFPYRASRLSTQCAHISHPPAYNRMEMHRAHRP